ncbi:hypothetical protein [Micromonospora sp. NPDC050200]|uniref:hypothetical protein n=1 Tax=Micromonospora sp. NPDC050200 TaxID=3155664 RepID=UPI0033E7577F
MNADFGGDQGRRGLDGFTRQACLDPWTRATQQTLQGYRQRGANLTNVDPALGFSKPKRGKKSVGYMEDFFQELLG